MFEAVMNRKDDSNHITQNMLARASGKKAAN